jgi:hypothetical protein
MQDDVSRLLGIERMVVTGVADHGWWLELGVELETPAGCCRCAVAVPAGVVPADWAILLPVQRFDRWQLVLCGAPIVRGSAADDCWPRLRSASSCHADRSE